MSETLNNIRSYENINLAPKETLRVAINLGNPVLARCDEQNNLAGVSVELAKLFSQYVNLPYELIPFDAAGKVFEALDQDTWDLAFLANDPKRAEKIIFSQPYVVIEGTYLVKKSSKFNIVNDLDQAGVKISVGKGAAYDLFLSRTLQHAQLIRTSSSESAIDYFLEEDIDAAAGIRQPLQKISLRNSNYKVLDDCFTQINQAMAVPKNSISTARVVESFIAEQLRSGRIQQLFKEDGQNDVSIPQSN